MFSRLSPFFFFFFFPPLYFFLQLIRAPHPFHGSCLTHVERRGIRRQTIFASFFFPFFRVSRMKKGVVEREKGETYSRIRKGGKCAYVGDKRNDKTKKQGRGFIRLFEKFRNICLLWILFYDSFLGNGKGEIDFSRNFMVGVIQTG